MAEKYSNPLLTVDIIVELADGTIVLIERKNPPYGWALPGGFVDYGEAIECAAIREAKEEISLDVSLTEQFYTYSDPHRDPRHHTVSTVFIATAEGVPRQRTMPKPCAPFMKTICPRRLLSIMREFYAITSASKKLARGRNRRWGESSVEFAHGFADSRASRFDVA